ncbi:MAG: hypothetical protein WCW25_04625 [Patescibacteria group bacterium]|jgi:hypothetical protein
MSFYHFVGQLADHVFVYAPISGGLNWRLIYALKRALEGEIFSLKKRRELKAELTELRKIVKILGALEEDVPHEELLTLELSKAIGEFYKVAGEKILKR